MKIVTKDIMKRLDQEAIKDYGIPGIVLMENAGRGATETILKQFTLPDGSMIGIFSGKGNNGGDGYVIARHLLNRGFDPKVFLLTSQKGVRGDAKSNLDILKNMGIKVIEVKNKRELRAISPTVEKCDLLVDAIFGTGLDSELGGFYSDVVKYLNRTGKPIVSIDIPSGLDADSGRPLGAAVKADLTITFGLPKLGQIIYPGAEYVGRLEIVDISLPKTLIDNANIKVELLQLSRIKNFFKPRKPESHKGDYGHLLVLAGSPGKTGAAAMACDAALRAGAGLVTLGIPVSLNPIMEAKLTEAMTEPLPETSEQTLGLESINRVQEIMKGKTAVALGPGISTNRGAKEFVLRFIENVSISTVIDADGINCLAQRLNILKNKKAEIIMTPHPGELGRLLKISSADVQNNRLGIAKEFAKKYDVILVLKGARTIIAEPNGNIFINSTGNPGMASGGMGDVLTGIIGGFLAQGFSPLEASLAGVYLHGLAGDRATQNCGESGLIATDVIEILPGLLKEFIV